LNGDSALYEERTQVGKRLWDIVQLADGRIVIWTDDGWLLVLSNLGEDVVASAFAQKVMKAFRDRSPKFAFCCGNVRDATNGERVKTPRERFHSAVFTGAKWLPAMHRFTRRHSGG
jgi:hypothetical protein